MPTIGADLAPSRLYVNEALFHPALDCVAFSWMTYVNDAVGGSAHSSIPCH